MKKTLLLKQQIRNVFEKYLIKERAGVSPIKNGVTLYDYFIVDPETLIEELAELFGKEHR